MCTFASLTTIYHRKGTHLMKKSLFFILFLTISIGVAHSQSVTPNVLFIGNSYTQVNDLPQMTATIAESMGDAMTYNSNTPGGCTFMQHCSNNSMNLIRQGGWDVVVLQEQSQYPSFPQSQVEAEVFPYAKRLVDSIYAHNPCAEPMFYMTWGRKNGDADNATVFPILGTYEGMDSMLCARYTYMAEANDASLCPVGRVWRYLRQNHSEVELYQSDESHPSLAGTYAAACAFYVMIFHRNPELIPFNGGLDNSTAQIIRSAVKNVVYDRLSDWQRPEPTADFNVSVSGPQSIILANLSQHADTYSWDFGDGQNLNTSDSLVTHTYASCGDFTVSLTASRHCMYDTATATLIISNDVGIYSHENSVSPLILYPNPAEDHVTLKGTGHITIYDMSGRIVKQINCSEEAVSIDLHPLPSGTYMVKSATQTRLLIVR